MAISVVAFCAGLAVGAMLMMLFVVLSMGDE